MDNRNCLRLKSQFSPQSLTQSSMITIKTTPEQISIARRMADDMGFIRHSMLKGGGNVTGFLGEVAYADRFGLNQDNSYDYDLMTKAGKTVDVKSKSCTSIPRSHYYVAVETRYLQSCDFYVFTRILKDLSTVYLLGWMKSDAFKRAAHHFPAGTPDPHDAAWKNKLDNLQLEIRQLNQF